MSFLVAVEGSKDVLLCCLWKARWPQRRQSVCVLVWRLLSRLGKNE